MFEVIHIEIEMVEWLICWTATYVTLGNTAVTIPEIRQIYCLAPTQYQYTELIIKNRDHKVIWTGAFHIEAFELFDDIFTFT